MSNFDSGVVYLCALEDVAEAGHMPVQKLVKKNKYWFMTKTIGFARQYAAKGANESIDFYIRVQDGHDFRGGMYAVLGNGEQYRVTYCTPVTGDQDYMRYTDVTLARLDKYFDVE